MRKEKILIFIPAYNVEKKITKVLNKIPKIVFNKYNINKTINIASAVNIYHRIIRYLI